MRLNTASFETSRLLVRACRLQDASALTNLMTPSISKWVAAWPTPLTLEATKSILTAAINAAQDGLAFGAVVIAKDTQHIIGWCKLDISESHAELGYWIGEAYQRNGFALELSQGAIAFTFEDLKLDVLRAGAQVENIGSLALLKKLGMTRQNQQSVWAPARKRFEMCEFWSLTSTT
ncbi:GNAT family N-acetyltransferase [Shimia marina]|uniref:Anhydro-N-acetylmuramic acid kinase n=1 Tax=Shimia marina TaxID=321267 RepID=A0A0P1F897_9RHOB|nr:GNAT family N-acetyltransferase [Shimia marina]CUH51221.1 anhydro-N-acetylmuramic acid kinase [Shimia marina]SFD54727.1 Acetyltransferase (GNAT) domain-containing protein [Shimia marina]